VSVEPGLPTDLAQAPAGRDLEAALERPPDLAATPGDPPPNPAEPVPAAGAAHGPEDVPAPLLDGQILRLDLDRAAELVVKLAAAAGRGAPADAPARALRRLRPAGEEAGRLIEAAIANDSRFIGRAAESDGVEPGALATVLRLAALPPLVACAGQLAGRIPRSWRPGYCPVCGAWPLLAELRGVERERVLRCGRCAAGWTAPWLCCVFCGERDHRRLGALAAAGELESRKAETCSSCRQYLKSVSVLAPLDPVDLLCTDLETVELDLAAQERGYGRPPEPGHPVACRVVPA
jgi:FdhE protein